jgi:hypothetical protein
MLIPSSFFDGSRQFDTTANTVISAAHFHAEAVAHSLEILSDTITSYSQDSDSYLPYVTVPRFEQRIAPIRESSGVLELTGFLPLVTTAQREFWETYVVQEQEWLQESYGELMLKVDQDIENDAKPEADPKAENFPSASETQQEYSVSEKISIAVGREYIVNPGSGPYAPIWQLSPPPPPSHAAIINTDLMSGFTFHALFDALINGDSSTGLVISHALPLSLYPANLMDHNNTQPSSSSEQSKSVLFHAIRNSHGKDGEVKGFAMGVLDWERFFSKLLPANVRGVDCVLHNPCDGQSHTFRIESNGCALLDKSEIYEGTHDTNHQTILTEFTSHASDAEGLAEASVCNYEIYIRPAPSFYSEMKSKGPAVFTACIASVFIGTGLIFVVYVYFISNRQNKVMAIAMSSAAIVSSLFPSTVRDRILRDAEEEVSQRMSERSSAGPGSGPLGRSRHKGRRASLKMIQEERKKPKDRSKPIADLFPEATVLFAGE